MHALSEYYAQQLQYYGGILFIISLGVFGLLLVVGRLIDLWAQRLLAREEALKRRL